MVGIFDAFLRIRKGFEWVEWVGLCDARSLN